MDLKERQEKAVFYKHNGCNCSQSVMLALNDLVGLDETLLLKLSSGFGQGMGGLRANCGSLIGAVNAVGILNDTKVATKFIAKDMASDFEKKCGSLDCHTLKGIETKKVLCSCDDCIRNAIEIMFNNLEKYRNM